MENQPNEDIKENSTAGCSDTPSLSNEESQNIQSDAKPQQTQKYKKRKAKKGCIISCGVLLTLIIILISGFIYVENNYLWCDWFPYLWDPDACAIYPIPYDSD